MLLYRGLLFWTINLPIFHQLSADQRLGISWDFRQHLLIEYIIFDKGRQNAEYQGYDHDALVRNCLLLYELYTQGRSRISPRVGFRGTVKISHGTIKFWSPQGGQA